MEVIIVLNPQVGANLKEMKKMYPVLKNYGLHEVEGVTRSIHDRQCLSPEIYAINLDTIEQLKDLIEKLDRLVSMDIESGRLGIVIHDNKLENLKDFDIDTYFEYLKKHQLTNL